MSAQTFYKYRSFNTLTLDLLCRDAVYFSSPVSFNDPLDCKPTLHCDSPNEDLKKLLKVMVESRVKEEIIANLKQARVQGKRATQYALDRANGIAAEVLNDITYNATNPDYDDEANQVESLLLVHNIEYELKRYVGGVCCFSTTYSNPLLWSHYGDQHHGLCIGYGVNRDQVPELKKVVYGGMRPINTSTLINAILFGDKLTRSDLFRDILLRKASGWRYEREWRLLGKQGVQSIEDFPLLLKEVIFGLRCNVSVQHTVVKALAGLGKNIKFYEMYDVRDSFKLYRRKLDTYERICLSLPSASGFEILDPLNDED